MGAGSKGGSRARWNGGFSGSRGTLIELCGGSRGGRRFAFIDLVLIVR
jgi:hypothetical protein